MKKSSYPIEYYGHTTLSQELSKTTQKGQTELTPQAVEARAMAKDTRRCSARCVCRSPIRLLKLFETI